MVPLRGESRSVFPFQAVTALLLLRCILADSRSRSMFSLVLCIFNSSNPYSVLMLNCEVCIIPERNEEA